MERLLGLIGKINKYICASFVATMVLLVFANTCLRYLFRSGIIMGEELVRYFFVWAVFLSVIPLYYEGRHIAVTTLTDRLSPKTLALFSFIANFGALYALYALCHGSLEYFLKTTTLGQATGLPYKLIVFPIIVSSFCCFGIVAISMVGQFRRYQRLRRGVE